MNLEPLKNYLFKHAYLKFYVSILVPVAIIGLLLVDPDFGLIQDLPYGSLLLNVFLFIAYGVLSSALLWITGAAFTDYGKYSDMDQIGEKCTEDPKASGLFALAIAIRYLAYAVVIICGFLVLK